MSEKLFQTITRIGAVVIVISLLLNIWMVLRHWDLSKRLAAQTPEVQQQIQQMSVSQQAMQNLLQEVLVRTQNNPTVVQILQRHNLISGPPPSPAPAPAP